MFRFTIRDVLWLTVVVGLLFGWGRRERDMSRNFEEVRHREVALTGIMMKQGWSVRWHGTTGEFERGDEKYNCPLPASETNYVWQRIRKQGQ
jgi:hypothetical protein